MIARMWEVKGQSSTLSDLVNWVCDTALPTVEDSADYLDGQVFRSQDRVVVITYWRADPRDLPEPPLELVARPPHSWDFSPVTRES